MVYCGIQELKLMTGVMAAPGDPNSAEQGIIRTIDLLTPEGLDGFRIDSENNWTPKRAQVKNGGLWVDTATADGRELLAAKRGNVVETITLLLRASTQLLLNKRMAELERFAHDASEFWETTAQVEPCYIKYWAQGAPGAQYALVYLVNADSTILDYGDVNQLPLARVVLVIEREYAWRMVAPGTNPIEAHFQLQGKSRGSTVPSEGYVYTDMSIQTKADHFKFGTVQNRTELGLTANKNFISGNWIDVSNVPGDAPALVCAAIRKADGISVTSPQRIFMAQSITPITLKSREAQSPYVVGDNLPAYAILNFADENGGVMTKANDACGVIGNNSNTTEVIETYTHPAGPATTFTMRARWAISLQPAKQLNLFRGVWMAFVRCKATNGSANDIRMRLLVRDSTYLSIQLDEVGIPLRTPGASCINEWALVYLGQFKLPFDKEAFSSPDGRGIYGGVDNVEFEIQTRNIIAATRTLEFLDLVLLPIDTAVCVFDRQIDSFASATLNAATVIFDNTGYLAHGKVGDYCAANGTESDLSSIIAYNQPQKFSGNIPQLVPGINNRLYFLNTFFSAALGLEYSQPEAAMELRLNIVPRWLGTRDI